MVNKKVLGIFLLSLFIVASIPVASAELPDLNQLFTNDDSIIDLVDIYLFVAPNGLLHMNETYYFTINENNKVFTRDIPIAEYQSVKNINVTGGNNNTFVSYEITEKGHNKHVEVTVYEDENLTTTPKVGTPVAVTINYDYLYLTEVYKDTGVIDLTFSWNKPVDQVILHPIYTSTDIEYWLQPSYVQHTDSWNQTILSVATGRISAGENIEFVSTIPHDYFDANPIYAHIIKTDGLNAIRLD
ncbi:MAG: hypothetical protein MJ209_01775 [archaeon]|nr:hypothetical protein [archaeon]